MRITADTNVLVRATLEDDKVQAAAARALLERASVIAIPIPALCEFVWVMCRGHGRPPAEIADVIAALTRIESVAADFAAIEAGLAVMRTGGDFADGAIAYQGAALGGTTFASFDRKAVAMLRSRGIAAADPANLLA